MTDLSEHSVHLARWEEETGLTRAFESAWSNPPKGGTVALITRCCDEQGARSERALPTEVIVAAARRLGSAGAQVRVIVVPGDMDELELHRQACEELEEAGLTVISQTAGRALHLDGEVLGKPGTEERAVAQLERMSGRSHRLLTAVAVHDTRSGETRVDLDVHTLTMRSLTRAQLEAYVRADRPLGCAGAYMLERRGIALFESIVADPALADDTAIIGLPMMRTLRLLRGFGMEVLEAPLTSA